MCGTLLNQSPLEGLNLEKGRMQLNLIYYALTHAANSKNSKKK
jgi:hypothetical protein